MIMNVPQQAAPPEVNPAKTLPAPSVSRAFVCLLLNVIVLPGLGTLMSGEPQRRRTGFFQLGMGLLLIPLMVIIGVSSAYFAGMSPDTIRSWLSNITLVLMLWSVLTGVSIIRDAIRRAKEQSAVS
jgi:hypothetical protein